MVENRLIGRYGVDGYIAEGVILPFHHHGFAGACILFYFVIYLFF